jgi:filamentous hemagglutinin family protein
MDRRLLLGTALCASATLAFAPPARAQPAPNARPAGGNVVAGAATIGQSSSTTTIDQSTQRAAINWKSFDVGSQQTVQFQQPSSSSVVLNRVVGPNPSQIAGQINANGQVVITNQSGVMFYKGSQVNTAGLMVSAAGIGNANFMAGRMVFDHAPNPNAKVVNQGSITVRDAGLAALVAPQVANSGVINARLGHVILAGARTVTLDLYGDGLMAIDVTGQVVKAPNGATALVTNTGIIRADGGTVQLTARAADGVVQTLVDAGGKVQAATVGDRTGTIVLNGVGGSITVAGQLSATGNAPGSVGGNIAVDPSGNVAIASGARVNASGQAGGGVIAIGTTLARAKGGPGVTPRRTAANVTVAAGATIAANATRKGNGGRVAVLSRSDTVMNGTISARGGPQGGNGGTVETSGNTLTVGPSAMVDTRAPQGLTGTWLIDPTNWVIADTGGNETPTQVVNALEESDETIAADNDITVTDPINATTDFYATNSLIFEAGRSILVNASITMNGGGFSATANDSSDLGTALADRLAGPGDFTMAPGTTINTSVGTEFTSVTVLGSATNTDGGGNFVPGTISLANLTTGGGEVTAGGGTGLGLSGNIDAGLVTLSANGAGGIGLDGAVNATTLTLSAAGGGGVTQDAAGVITATDLGISSTGSVSLVAANSVTTLAAVVTDSGSSFSFRDDSTPLIIGKVGFADEERDFISGITTNDGQIALSTTTSGSVTANAQISSTGGEIDVAAAPGSGFTNNTDSTLETPTSISSGNGNVVLLADSMTLATNSTIDAGSGTVVLGPATTSDTIVLGAASTTGTLGLQTSDFATITAGMIEVGYRSEDATALFTGNITIGGTAGISLNPADVPVLLLVTGGSSGTVTQTEPVAFSAPGGTLGVIAGGTVTLTGANTVSTFAGFADNGSTLTFDNSGPLTVGALPAQQLGVAVDGTTGLVSSAPMATGTGNPSNPLTGVTATGGGDIAVKTTTGGLTLSSNVTAVGETVTLTSAGAINQTAGVITAAILTGSSVGGATLTQGNAVGALGPFSDTGTGNTPGLSLTDGQALQTAGLVSSTGPLALTTTTGCLTLGGDVTASGQTVTLTSAGAISQTGGLITAATLTGSSVDGTTLTQGNAVSTLGPFSDTGTDNTTGLSFTDGQTLQTSGLVSSTGPLALTTTTGGLTLGGDVTAVGETVTLTSAGAISQTAGLITAGTLTGGSVDGATLTLVNAVGALGPFTDTGTGNTTGLSFTDGQALRTSGVVSSTGPLTLTTTTGGLTLGGNVTAAGKVVTLTSTGAISQTAGVITAATLTGSSIDGATLAQGNAVSTLGPFSDTGTGNTTGLSFTDGQALQTSGVVSSTGPLALTTTTGGLTLGGDVTANGRTVTLTSAGAISQTAGVITAATLTGSSAGNATLAQGNAIGTFGPFTVGGGSLVLYDASALTIAGPIAADFFTITATGRMTLAGNIATIGAPLAQQSGPTPAPGGSTLQVLALETASGPVAQFVQTGTVMLTDPPATTLRIELPATGGTASFAGLAGPGAELVLALGSGTATGTMEIGGLVVLGTGGSATLVGSVAGVTTRAAAALGEISPAVDPSYTFNDCIIGSAVCGAPTPPPVTPVLVPTPPLVTPVLGDLAWFLPGPGLPPVPSLPTLNLIVLPGPPLMSGQLAPQDVVPPNISFEDY